HFVSSRSRTACLSPLIESRLRVRIPPSPPLCTVAIQDASPVCPIRDGSRETRLPAHRARGSVVRSRRLLMRRLVSICSLVALAFAPSGATAAAANTCVFTVSMTSGTDVNNLDLVVDYLPTGG